MREAFNALFKGIFKQITLLLALLLPTSVAWAEGPNVVVSIAPIHSLVAAVMEGVGSPELLYPSGQSPHSQSLRPSAVSALINADLVIWIDPNYEITMSKLVKNNGNEINIKSLIAEAGLSTYPVRTGGAWVHQDEHIDEPDHKDNHDTAYIDPHVWLSTANASLMVNLFKGWLIDSDPDNAARYQKNAEDVIEAIGDVRSKLVAQLTPVKSIPYIVFHDAYQYFEAEFELTAIGSVTLGADKSPGARRIKNLREMIEARNTKCVFSEPQFEPRLLRTITEGSETKIGQLDPLGVELMPGSDLWFQLMTSLAKSMVACLKQS